jgi:hypothetical protein
MWIELCALAAILTAIVHFLFRPMTVNVPKIDATGPSTYRTELIANVIAYAVIAAIILAILGILVLARAQHYPPWHAMTSPLKGGQLNGSYVVKVSGESLPFPGSFSFALKKCPWI